MMKWDEKGRIDRVSRGGCEYEGLNGMKRWEWMKRKRDELLQNQYMLPNNAMN